MPGIGTLVNVAAIIIAGIVGCLCGNKVHERVQDTLMSANAVSVLFLGISGTLAKMLVIEDGELATQGTLMLILSLAIGSVAGELLNLEDKMETFGEWLKKKSGNAKDPRFVDAFVTSSLTVCVGAMAIVGAIEDGVYANPIILFSKAILDFVIILVMSASMGKGCAFSAIPVAILQGSITIISFFLKGEMSDAVMYNLSYVGSALIFCVGINLLFGKKIRVGNLLPALIVGGVWALF